ncbi:MAG: pyridoxal phosphate-dependent decarboxylase family protein, partial [Paracoccaceae bacterium]
NPHKWLGAQFDCSIQFLANPSQQIRTMGQRPSYMETPGQPDGVNYSEWTLPLGRRFRALKLWFVLRYHGLEGLRTRIRNHVAWARELAGQISALPHFEVATPCNLALFTFRFAPPGRDADEATADLLGAINDDGRIYLTQARHEGRLVIRFQVGQFDCTRDDVMSALDVLREVSRKLGR